MKRTLALILALVLLLTTFTGCMKKKSGTKAEDTSEYEALYAPVLKKYKQAFDENWPREKFIENNLSPNLANLDKTAEPSFAFLDLDGDKTPELFIGRADRRAEVYDLYTVDGETIRQLTDPADESALTLTDDDQLVQQRSEYEHLDVTTLLALQGGRLTATRHYIYDAAKMIDGMDDYFVTTSDLPEDELEIYADQLEVISKADYDRAAKDYKRGALPLQDFSRVKADDTAGLRAEDAVAIYMNDRSVWMDDFARQSASDEWRNGKLFFLDLDFDGVLELCTWWADGSHARICYNDFYRINTETGTVSKLNSTYGYDFTDPEIVAENELDPMPLLLRDRGTGEPFYYFTASSQSGWQTYEASYYKGYPAKQGFVSENLFAMEMLEGEETDYIYQNGEKTAVSKAEYDAAMAQFFADNPDLNLKWKAVSRDDVASADTAALTDLLLSSYRAFGYDGYVSAGGMRIERYTPPISDEDALGIYTSNLAAWYEDSGTGNFHFIDLDGDGVMELRKTVKDWSSTASSNTYYKIDRAEHRVVRVPATGPAASFDKFLRTLKHRTDGTVQIFCEDFEEVGTDQYERSYGVLRLTDAGVASDLLFARRYRTQTLPGDYFDHADGGYLKITQTEYFCYENGEKTSVSEADYNARMADFFAQYDQLTAGGRRNLFYFSGELSNAQGLICYQSSKAKPLTSLALTEAPETPAADRGGFLTANADDWETLDLFSYIYGGGPIMGINDAQSEIDLMNYDYRDADAAEKAYRHLSFGLFGTPTLEMIYINGSADTADQTAQDTQYEKLPASKWRIEIPGKTPSSEYDTFIPWYYKLDADFFDAVLRAGYNVAPDHSYVFSNLGDNGTYRQKIAFYDGGFYYVASPETGDIIIEASDVSDVTQNRDGTYTVRYHCADATLDDWDNFTDFREREVTEFEITLALKELDGKRVWSFYQIKEVF